MVSPKSRLPRSLICVHSADHVEAFRRLPGVRVVGLADVDASVLAREAKRFEERGEKVEAVADVRRLLERDDVDALSIATPNHWHALQAIWACQAGKDVYVEKPVSHNVWEGGQLVRAARKYGRIVQAGTQARSARGIAEAIAWLRAGNLGKIELARGLCYKPRQAIGKVTGPQAVPSGVDFDLWTGPAPKKSLLRRNLHYDWHWVFDTGDGDVGNQGVHQMDIARWALGEDGLPRATLSAGGRLGYDDDGETPNTQLVLHDYGPDRPRLLFEVRGLPRAAELQADGWTAEDMDELCGARVGVVVHCEKGTMRFPDYEGAVAFDRAGKELARFAGSEDHFANFAEVVRSRRVEDLAADVREGHVSSALCHLGNVAHRLGRAVSPAEARAELEREPAAAEALERMLVHLEQNGVDLGAAPLTLGAAPPFDPAGERFADETAQRLAQGAYRVPFAVPADP